MEEEKEEETAEEAEETEGAEDAEDNSNQKTIGPRAVSPNYYITPMNPKKFTKGTLFGNKVCFGKTFDQDLDGKIIIYEDRVKGWFLDHAKTLIKEQHADFVVLMICTSHLEGNQQFKEGQSSKIGSSEVIKRALKSIFSIPEEKDSILDLFVNEVRNGFFHEGMTRNFVSINRNFEQPISISEDFGGMIKINPILFLWVIEEDFKEYIINLRNLNNEELRENFEKQWEERHKIEV